MFTQCHGIREEYLLIVADDGREREQREKTMIRAEVTDTHC